MFIEGDEVKCIDPGKELGLVLDGLYIVHNIIDTWTIAVTDESGKVYSPRMAGRFELVPIK